MSAFSHNYPATGSSNKKYLDANNNQNTDIGQYLALGAGGNVFGTAMGLGANAIQQNMQMQNQKELMTQQTKDNERLANTQIQREVLGMQNAGLNPAGTNTTVSTPTAGGGSAGIGSMGLANVFDGIANIIQAAKAPSEIAQIKANTAKTGAETENITYDYTTLKPEQIKKMEQEITKLNEDIQTAKNINDVYQTKSEFIKTYGPSVFSGWRDQLKATKNWDKLPEKTRQTIDSWANGDIELDVGSAEALNEIIRTQTNLSEADKTVMQNLVGTTVALKQLKDNNITTKLAKMSSAQFDKLINEINLIDERTTNQKIKNWSDIVNDKNFMITKGLYEDLLKVEGLEQAEKTMDDLHSILQNFSPGKKIKKGKTVTTKSGRNAKGSYSETTTTDYGL